MGTTEAEWLMRLPLAVGPHALQYEGSTARVALNTGQLLLRWQVLPPRAIALLRMPRLEVGFVFEGVDAASRLQFMQRFDLTMQRGGG